MKFIWDENKNQQNIKEDRYIILGISKLMKLLIVCHSYKENDEIIRIFSSRKAVKKEIKEYGGK